MCCKDMDSMQSESSYLMRPSQFGSFEVFQDPSSQIPLEPVRQLDRVNLGFGFHFNKIWGVGI